MVTSRRHHALRGGKQRGFTYVWVMMAVAVMAIGLLAVSEIWATSARRQKLVELDWIGAQFIRAIGSYYEATPGVVVKTYPASLHDLLEDRRYVTVRRYLRDIYLNPFTGKADWDLITTPEGGIRGVRVVVPAESGVLLREYVYRRSQLG